MGNLLKSRFTTIIFLTIILSSMMALSVPVTYAQTTYTLNGEIGESSINYIWIGNVKANDAVLLSITAKEGDPYYQSQISYSNLTVASYDSGRSGAPSGFGYVYHGLHSHEFVATEGGNYLLKLWTDSADAFNYTIGSTAHPIVFQDLTKSSANLQSIGFSESNYFYVNNVKANEVVLLGITPEAGDPYYQSQISYSNLTVASYDSGRSGAPSGFGYVYHGLHSHEFVATEGGNYLLKLWTDSADAFNYTISYTHQDPSEIQFAEIKPSPTSTSTASPSIKIAANSGDEVTFTIPSNLVTGNAGPYVFNFGDGTSTTTSDLSSSHTYKASGNYTVTISYSKDSAPNVIQSYLVTVTSKPAGTSYIEALTDPRSIAGIVSAIVAALALILNYQRGKRKKKKLAAKTQAKQKTESTEQTMKS